MLRESLRVFGRVFGRALGLRGGLYGRLVLLCRRLCGRLLWCGGGGACGDGDDEPLDELVLASGGVEPKLGESLAQLLDLRGVKGCRGEGLRRESGEG